LSRWQTKIEKKLLLLIFFILFFVQGVTASIREDVAPGLRYKIFSKSFAGRTAIKIHTLIIDLNSPNVQVQVALAKRTVGRLQTTSRMAYENGAIAAINGGFFDRSWPYLPVGLLVVDGTILTKSLLNRSSIGISKDKKVRFGIPRFVGYVTNLSSNDKIAIFGINRPRRDDEVIIYTAEYGRSTKTNDNGVEIIVENDMVVGLSDGDSTIPRNGYVISFHGWTKNYANALPPGAPISSDFNLTDGWDKYEWVLTGGPRLLDGGNNVAIQNVKNEDFDTEFLGRDARTAVGLTSRNELVMVVAEGRKGRRGRSRKGITFNQLADFFKSIGVNDAIALDGGGSSTMYINGKTVNSAANGSYDRVSNAIIVKSE